MDGIRPLQFIGYVVCKYKILMTKMYHFSKKESKIKRIKKRNKRIYKKLLSSCKMKINKPVKGLNNR